MHIDYIQELLSLSTLSEDSLFSALGDDPWKKRIALCKEADKWKQAIQICTDRLKYFRKSLKFQNELAELHFSATLAKLSNGKSQEQQLQDAKTLEAGINHLEKLSKDYPDNLNIFELLGYLNHWHAIKLVNADYLAEALLAVYKARTYNPYLEKADKMYKELIKKMIKLISQSREINVKKPNKRLTKKEKHLQTQASKGFTLRDIYMNSREAKATAEAFKVAQTGKTFVAKYPGLVELEPVTINALSERKIFGDEDKAVVEKTPVSPLELPILIPLSSKCQRETGIFTLWLFSRQDISLKFQAALAGVLLLTAGGLTIRESLVRSARDNTYKQILEAAERQDHLSVVKEAEAFFATAPLSGKDERNQQVKQLYAQAFVRWVFQQGDPLDEKALVHIKRYQALMNHSR